MRNHRNGDVLLWRDTYFNICRSSLTKKDVKQSHNIIADTIATAEADLVTKVSNFRNQVAGSFAPNYALAA